MTSVDLVIVIVGVALVFDYINGFHDAANSIATVVATRVESGGRSILGGHVQFSGGLSAGNRCRLHNWKRLRQRSARHALGSARGSRGSNTVGRFHLVSGAAHQFLPRADRRL